MYERFVERKVMLSHNRGLDFLGGEVVARSRPQTILGAMDIGAWQLQMNTLKQVPVSVAQVLVKFGLAAIDYAKTVAQQSDAMHPFTTMPGGTARDNVYWKLKWHETEVAKVASTPSAMYASGDDLKKWTTQALIEINAVEDGSARLDQMWVEMWKEIGAKLAALPKDAYDKATQGLDWLKWGLIGLASLVGAGVVYKVVRR